MFKKRIKNIGKNSNEFNCDKQITRLYTSSLLGGLSLTGAWVAILAYCPLLPAFCFLGAKKGEKVTHQLV